MFFNLEELKDGRSELLELCKPPSKNMPSLSRARAGKRCPRHSSWIRREIADAARPTPRRSPSTPPMTAVGPVGVGSSTRHCREDTMSRRSCQSVWSKSRGRSAANISTRISPGRSRAPAARRGLAAHGYVPDSDRCTEILIQFGTSFERPVRQPAGKGERRHGGKTAGPRTGIGRKLREKKNAACGERGAARWVHGVVRGRSAG